MIRRCRGCGEGVLRPLFDLGRIPSVNRFLTHDELDQEKPLPLRVGWCPTCSLVQLRDEVPPAELFGMYQHLSSASGSNTAHLDEVAKTVTKHYQLNTHSKILDIGSNDGSLLSCFKSITQNLLGVDPARNVAELAARHGIKTVTDFLTKTVAQRISAEHGHFDIVTALNIVAHTPDVNQLLRAVKTILSPTGTFIMEAVYVFDTILKGEFDTVYHEHVYCFSLTALTSLFSRCGLTITNVEHIPTQGGSLRVFAQHAERKPRVSNQVSALLQREAKAGVKNPAMYQAVGKKIAAFKNDFRKRLKDLHVRHGHVIGLGAPARGVVILNYTGIGSALLEAVVDDTPLKIGRLVPGVHIPVISWEALAKQPAAAYVLLSWNYVPEMIRKLKTITSSGEVLIPFPKLHVQQLT